MIICYAYEGIILVLEYSMLIQQVGQMVDGLFMLEERVNLDHLKAELVNNLGKHN